MSNENLNLEDLRLIPTNTDEQLKHSLVTSACGVGGVIVVIIIICGV